MKVCCINPPIEDFYSTAIRRQPLGLLYIMATLITAGHEVIFINGHTPKAHPMETPAEFSYITPLLCPSQTENSFPFQRYYHFGMSWQEMEQRISSADTEIFFISSLFTTYYEETARVVAIIRKRKKHSIIIAGGYHAALHPDYFLDDLAVDYVITGEGETASVRILEFLEGKRDEAEVPGLYHKGVRAPNTKTAEDIDALTPPARELLMERDFRMYRKKAVSMITSRGCPNNCSFCTGKSIWGSLYRKRNIDDIIREIDECRIRYGTQIINFEDDNLFPTHSRSSELLGALTEYTQSGYGVRALEFTAMNGISLENLEVETVNEMKKAGFRELNISLVTNSQILQKKYNRPFDSNYFAEIASSAHHSGFNVRAYYILGLPGQTREEIVETLIFLESLKIKVFPSVYYNVNAPKDQWKMQRSSAFFNETDTLNREDLLTFFNKSMLKNVKIR